LSKQEGIPEDQWCYKENKDGMLDFVPDYQKRLGYRLPTEAEWEFACRAGARTGWCFGEADEELVGKYAWWSGNAHVNGVRRSFPVATLKPNDWGLFDMHGNLNELCMESAGPQERRFANDVECAFRGGYYHSFFQALACDQWFVIGRKVSLEGIGCRLVRTLPAGL
jgi:hypothetical protein